MLIKKLATVLTGALAIQGLATTAYAGGFEQLIFWGAEHVGRAGVAAGHVSGPDALYFNPAGLVRGEAGVSLNLSPTFSSVEAPLTEGTSIGGSPVTGDEQTSAVLGFLGSNKIGEKWAIGYGVYASGGTTAKFKNAQIIPNQDSLVDLQGTVQAIEIGLGGAYAISDNWSVGATWRATLVEANFRFATVSSTTATAEAFAYTELDAMEGDNFSGFRLGTQYLASSKNWGVGLSVRTKAGFEVEGDFRGRVEANTPALVQTSTQGTAPTISSELPTAVYLESFLKLADDWTLYTGLNQIYYSSVDVLNLEGTYTNALVNSGAETALPDITSEWDDQLILRIGAEHNLSDSTDLRFGYIYGSQVVKEERARATFTPPGPEHVLTLGGGFDLGDSWDVDVAASTTMFSGGDVSSTNASINDGEYSASKYAIHLSALYTY